MLPDWSGRTAVCIASGPSLTAEDCEAVRAIGYPVVVTNTTFRLCTWAHALFGFDAAWWQMYIEEVKRVFGGRLFSKSSAVRKLGVEWAGKDTRFMSFGLSGTDSIALAIGAGARRIIMLGHDVDIDDGRTFHHHGDHPAGLQNCKSMHTWPGKYGRLARYAKHFDARVINASRRTSLDCFERMPLERCL